MPECLEHPTGLSTTPAVGGPFYDCGMGPVIYRSPSPTTLPHGFGYLGTALDDSSICILPFVPQGWWSNFSQPLPDIVIGGSNRVIHNAAEFPGDIIFAGERVQWVNAPGVIGINPDAAYYCAPGAWQVEVDGECLCPVPEPGLTLALMLGVLAIAARATRRSRRS